jgi:hypothetical protein
LKPTEFAQLFPEIENPNEYLPKIIGACKKKNFPMEELQTFLHDLSLIRQNYSGYLENPGGYLRAATSNKVKKYFSKNLYYFEDVDTIKDTDILEDFDKKPLQRKLEDFSGEIDKINLPQNQHRLVEEMIRLCQEDHLSMKDFMEEVRIAMENYGVSPANFRKILERLRGNLSNNSDLKGMLSFTPNQAENNKLLNLIIYNMNELNLQAYRFSSEEMSKMLWLKELFENNGFTVGRFPEVYLDTFVNLKDYLQNEVKNSDHSKEIKDWYEQMADDTNWTNLIKQFDDFQNQNGFEITDNLLDFLKNNLTPDILGVYIFNESNLRSDCDCGVKYAEGKIILFQDRIQKISALISSIEGQHIDVIVDTLRFNVLMHELGHWLTHWARSFDGNKKKYVNWECGYYLNPLTNKPDVKTHESLAQLICYWATYDKPFYQRILLDYLTPSSLDNEYNKYLALIDSSKHEVLRKLKIIRTLCEMTDSEKYEFLISNFNSIKEFIANQIYKEIRKLSYGDNVKLDDIIRTNSELTKYIFELIRIEHNKGESDYDFQIILKQLNELNENHLLYKMWAENKKYFGEFNPDLSGASMLKRFGVFNKDSDE